MSYTCPRCRKEHSGFKEAAQCCKADYVECPLSELPDDALLSPAKGSPSYSYGTVFTKRWELVLNRSGNTQEPVRVYPLPPLVNKMVHELFKRRFEMGADSVRSELRQVLGLDH